MDQFFQFDWSFIDRVGNNPFQAMWFFFLNGGWIVLVILFLYGAVKGRQVYKQNVYTGKKTWVVLAIDVPRMHEQGPRAVENAFAYMAGAHSKNSWTEQWIIGKTQDTISCEIVSIDGHIRFIIRTTRSMRNLVESAIFSQYPDAEITEVEDYARQVPAEYPNEEWDAWATEFIPASGSHDADVFPIRTYPFFEDKVSGEFKDPLAALLEGFSRLEPGEQAWYQIVLTPIAQDAFHKKAEHKVKKMKGEEIHAKKTALDHVVDIPMKAVGMALDQITGAPPHEKPKKEYTQPKIMGMTQGEKDVIEGIEHKASKIVFWVKIRFLYIAKKQQLVKSHAVHPFIGAIKQFNTNNMLSLKPESKKVGVSSTLWWFKTARNDQRKSHLVKMYRNRTNWAGTPNFHLNIEELATLWHFPHALQVKTPQIKKTEAKRSEPPANIPFA